MNDEAVEESAEVSTNSRHENIMESIGGFLTFTAFGLLQSYELHRALRRFVWQPHRDLMRVVACGFFIVSRARCTSPYQFEAGMAEMDAITQEMNWFLVHENDRCLQFSQNFKLYSAALRQVIFNPLSNHLTKKILIYLSILDTTPITKRP